MDNLLFTYTGLVSKFLFPLHETFKGHTSVSVLKNLECSQWWEQKQLEQLQLTRLQLLLSFSGKHVPYYKKLFAEIDFNPQSVSSLSDLRNLPYLSKNIIRDNLESFKSNNAYNLHRFNTGGSSGQPLIFFIGKERVSHDVAAKWRATRWWDVDIGDTEIVVWGSPIELNAQDYMRLLRDKMLRTTLLPAFEMSESKLDNFVGLIQKKRPKMIFGYPSSLSLLADHAKQRNQLLNNLGIKVAFVTSERLYDYQRHAIEQAFGCVVANGYGGRDSGFIAHDCPAGNMHITAEDIIVEIIDSNGKVLPKNQLGEIVVTHLATKDFPFIRYRTGDIGSLDDKVCSCGRGLPLLKEIQGRSTDFILASDGTIMHGLALIYILRDIANIESFKIIQESLKHIRVLVVPSNDYTIDTESKIRNGFLYRLGEEVNISIEQVNEIPAESSGKFRFVVSKII